MSLLVAVYDLSHIIVVTIKYSSSGCRTVSRNLPFYIRNKVGTNWSSMKFTLLYDYVYDEYMICTGRIICVLLK